MNRKILLILILLVALPLVSSLDNIGRQDQLYDIRVVAVQNGTIDNVLANVTVNDPDGIVLIPFQDMTKNTDSQDFNYTLPISNTSKIGLYDCTVYAFSDLADNQAFSCNFEINPSGKEYIPEISGPLIFGAILTLMFISVFLLILGWKIELFPMKVFLIILAGIVAIMNIGFVAGSFQEFFSTDSALSGSFGSLYIMFIVLLAGASIFLLIWVILTAAKLYKIKRGFYIDPD